MTGGDGGGPDPKNAALSKNTVEKSFSEESVLALKQLGVIIGVCFMVGSLFMLMVGVEILWGKVEEKYQEVTGKQEEPEKDPAALVGTFSRYRRCKSMALLIFSICIKIN